MQVDQLLLPWKPVQDAAAELLKDPRTTATTVMVLAYKAVGDALFGDPDQEVPPIDPVELWTEMEEVYSTHVSEAAENRLNALLLALESDAFDTEPDAFMAVCNSLADGDLGDMIDGAIELPTFDEALWALAEVSLIRGQVVELTPATIEVLATIAADEDESPEKAANDQTLVLERAARLQAELLAIGAPSALVESIPRRMNLGV